MILFANCKINIGLDILRRRNDGYHDIETLMYPVSGLCDSVEVVAHSAPGAYFTSSGLVVDCPPESNLCLRAYELLRSEYAVGGARIHLHKCVPFGAGLGGGSADAAAVIVALNRVFGLGLSLVQLEALAAKIGSDVPFFIRNIPQFASGRGEILTPYGSVLSGLHLIIVKHDVAVSTAQAYAGVVPRVAQVPLAQRLLGDISTWRDCVENDFEASIFAVHPLLALTKKRLYDAGALYAAMSGSGAAVYGIFEQKPDVGDEFSDAFVYQQIMS